MADINSRQASPRAATGGYEYLIPWFTPRLTRVRTLAAGGVTRVQPTFEDFNRLFLFTYLEPQYRNRAYVAVDGDEVGKDVIARLRDRYPGWNPDCFITFVAEDFESYYPKEFAAEAKRVLEIADRQQRRAEKAQLVETVVTWVEADRARARVAFEESAQEVVTFLRRVDDTLFG